MARGRKTGGRRRGTPNRVPAELRTMVVNALERAGGEEYLAAQALENPAPFLALLGKCLPREAREAGGPVAIHVVTGIDPSLGEPGSSAPEEALR